MSADNGIYILKTKDQYRVIHAMAIDNLYWSLLDEKMHDELIPTRIVEYYGESRYTRDFEKSQKVAFAMANDYFPILEYGIRILQVNKTWKRIVEEAKEMVKLEIEEVKKKQKVENHSKSYWNHRLERLEKVLSYKN